MNNKEIKSVAAEMSSGTPEVVEESKEISRRRFIRKSAEVAAASLFGVLGFDAVADKVLERIAETKGIGLFSNAAAGVLRHNRLDYYANASDYRVMFVCSPPVDWQCSPGEDVSCGAFTPDCSVGNPYGCTTRSLLCNMNFNCPGDYNCTGDTHTCRSDSAIHCTTAAFDDDYTPPSE
ncbi:MAG: hypothetical protein ABFD49_01725 [Armatimonadota bacterium]|nr:hypothetical protein [bacterium]